MCPAVAGAFEGFDQLGVVMDPVHEAVHGALLGEAWSVSHGELRFAHGANLPRPTPGLTPGPSPVGEGRAGALCANFFHFCRVFRFSDNVIVFVFVFVISLQR